MRRREEDHQPTAGFARVIFASLLFVVAWIGTAALAGFGVAMIFPPPGEIEFGIGFEWRNLPGTVAGFLVACWTWRTMIAPRERGPNEPQTPARAL